MKKPSDKQVDDDDDMADRGITSSHDYDSTTSIWNFRYARYVIVHGAGAQGLGLISADLTTASALYLCIFLFSGPQPSVSVFQVKNTFYDFETDCTPLGNRP